MKTPLQLLKAELEARSFKSADENYSIGAQDAIAEAIQLINSLEEIEQNAIMYAYNSGFEDACEGIPSPNDELYFETTYGKRD